MTDGVLIRFRLIGDEAQAMNKLSVQESRRPRDQVRHILRQELERRGLLPKEVKATQSQAVTK
ncbi:MAG: hypothetical protein GY832_36265 [Chloroflexi bacterium]|nr:hypothetical protein [Chloroflexota bacterium]